MSNVIRAIFGPPKVKKKCYLAAYVVAGSGTGRMFFGTDREITDDLIREWESEITKVNDGRASVIIGLFPMDDILRRDPVRIK